MICAAAVVCLEGLTMVKGKFVVGLAVSVLLAATASANASSYYVTLLQVGPNVVATGSGAIDLTGLGFDSTQTTFGINGALQPSLGEAVVFTGFLGVGNKYDTYIGAISGPIAFGSGGQTAANSGSGTLVGLVNGPFNSDGIVVPHGYLSGTAVSDSSTYLNRTFASLGVTPGTYEWTWGNQSFTLQVGDVVATPLPAALPLFATGLGVMGLLGWRRKRKGAAEAAA
jgi:hypothetical protein